MSQPPPSLWKRLSLVLGGLVAGILVAEIAARRLPLPGEAHLALGMAPAMEPGLFSMDPVYGLVPTPGFEGVLVSPGSRVPVRINSLGMRGGEPPAADGTDRWLLLGDSFTMGLQVREEQTVAAQLEATLDSPVLNGGVSGDDTWDSLARYQLLSHALRPSGVILILFAGNDLVDNSKRGPSRLPDPPPPLSPRAVATPEPPWVTRTLRERSLFYAHLRLLIHRLLGDGFPSLPITTHHEGFALFTQQGSAGLDGILEHTRRALDELVDRTQARQQALLVAVAPPIYAVDSSRFDATARFLRLEDPTPALDAPQQALLSELQDLGLPSCDLTTALRGSHDAGDQPYLHLDGHWSATGHAVAAQRLAWCLSEME